MSRKSSRRSVKRGGAPFGGVGYGRKPSRKATHKKKGGARCALVRKVMNHYGLGMIEASHYVKKHKLY